MKNKGLLMLIFALFFSFSDVYGLDTNITSFEIDRKVLQDYVKSTAYQYYYKTNYTDYEQGVLDNTNNPVKTNSFMFRDFSVTPEQLNETTTVNFDCASFVLNVYMNSLGYYFGDYYKKSPSYYFYYNTDNSYYRTNSNINYYTRGILDTGRGFNSEMLSSIINNGKSYKKGIIYNYDSNNDLVIFNYLAKGNETSEEINNFYDTFTSKLQDGDIVYINRVKNGKNLRHSLLYFNDIDDVHTRNSRSGFLHSIGTDYSFSDPSKGDDVKSISIIEKPYFKLSSSKPKGYFFSETSSGYLPESISIIRPINEIMKKKYTNIYDKKYGSNVTSENTVSRNELKDLMIEQNAYYVDATSEKPLSIYNSVNIGETLKLSLRIINVSDFNDYNVSISSVIPANTTYINCDDCSYNKESNIIYKKNLVIDPGEEYVLNYYVKVGNKYSVKNLGFKITAENGKVLTMPQIEYFVYPTFRNFEKDELISAIEKLRTSNKSLSKLSILQNIYKSVGINLGEIDNYKNGLFLKNKNGYVRRNNTYSDVYNINKMSILGLYGGREVRGNFDKLRTRNIEFKHLEIGDLLILGSLSNSYIYLGNVNGEETLVDTNYKYYKNTSALNKLRSVYTYDDFIVLRPSKGRLVNAILDYNGKYENQVKRFSSGSKFSLDYPSKVETVTYDYGENYFENFKNAEKVVNKLSHWVYNGNIVDNNTLIPYQNNISLKAVFSKEYVILPFPNIEGRAFAGWYDKNDNKLGNADEKYFVASDMTMYAKWHQDDIAHISLNNSSFCNLVFESYNVKAGETVKFRSSCKKYYRFIGFKEEGIKLSKDEDGNYIFKMPNKDIDLTVNYTIDLPKVSMLKATPTSYINIKLSWNKLIYADGYDIYKCLKSKCTFLNSTRNNYYNTSYKVQTGEKSYYKVRAYKYIDGYKVLGADSSIVGAITFLNKPSISKITKINSKKLKLYIKKVPGAHGYYIYRSTSKSKGYKKIAITSRSYYINKNLKSNKKYYYKIKAYRNINNKKVFSSFSSVKYKKTNKF